MIEGAPAQATGRLSLDASADGATTTRSLNGNAANSPETFNRALAAAGRSAYNQVPCGPAGTW